MGAYYKWDAFHYSYSEIVMPIEVRLRFLQSNLITFYSTL